MPAASKSKVETSIMENRITLIFSRILRKKELDSIYTDVRFATKDLKPGFNVISDFSETKLLYLNGLGVFRKIFNFILSNESGEIVRVIQDNRLIYKQLLNLSLRAPGYTPVYAPTIEKAQAKIKQAERRNGLRFNLLQHPVEFLIGGEKHDGAITNISTSGCAILSNSLQPEMNSPVEVIFSLNDQKRQSRRFSIKSKVVRVENDVFAVSFIDIDKNNKNNLWNCIVTIGR